LASKSLQLKGILLLINLLYHSTKFNSSLWFQWISLIQNLQHFQPPRWLSLWKVRGSNPQSGQVKDWKIGACCFPG